MKYWRLLDCVNRKKYEQVIVEKFHPILASLELKSTSYQNFLFEMKLTAGNLYILLMKEFSQMLDIYFHILPYWFLDRHRWDFQRQLDNNFFKLVFRNVNWLKDSFNKDYQSACTWLRKSGVLPENSCNSPALLVH